MSAESVDGGAGPGPQSSAAHPGRPLRADARRSVDALLDAAKAVFASTGVDAPIREIAARAGVGLATLYRHFPQRSDLIAAVFRREIDACAAAGDALAAAHPPVGALAGWLRRYTDFLATKRGMASALHSGDPAYTCLPAYFQQRLSPALASLLATAVAAGEIRPGVEPYDLLRGVGNLCLPAGDDAAARHTHRMVGLLIDGLRFGAAGADTAARPSRP